MDRKEAEREQFLKAIRDNPYDESVRAIYADWLDDHDEPEEADFFRKWTLEKHKEAEEIMDEFAYQIAGYYGDEDDEPTIEWLQLLLEKATQFQERGKYYTLPFQNPYWDNETMEKFWEAYEILTARRLRENADRGRFLGCSC